MARLIPVYQFEYFDRSSSSIVVSADFATETAIKSVGGMLLAETGKEVPEGEVTFSGIWRPDRSRPHGA